MTKLFVDFYCPHCGQKHEAVELNFRSDVDPMADSSAMRFGLTCDCGVNITVFADRDSRYLSVSAKNFDKPTLIYEEDHT